MIHSNLNTRKTIHSSNFSGVQVNNWLIFYQPPEAPPPPNPPPPPENPPKPPPPENPEPEEREPEPMLLNNRRESNPLFPPRPLLPPRKNEDNIIKINIIAPKGR